MGLTKWSTDQTSKFIALYKEQQCLWRIDSMEYRNKVMRDEALMKISQGMQIPGLTIEDVKKKIKHLRSTYLMELRKVEKCFGYGTVYTPSLSWYKEMDEFIRDVTAKRSINCNVSNNTANEMIINDSEIQTEFEQDFQDQQEDQEFESDECELYEPPQASTPFNAEPFPENTSKETRLNKLNSLVKDMRSFVNELKGQEENDEFDIFGKHVAVQLRSLPLEEALIVQTKIQSIITHSRLNSIRSQRRNANNEMETVKLCNQIHTSDADDSSECSISLLKKESV